MTLNRTSYLASALTCSNLQYCKTVRPTPPVCHAATDRVPRLQERSSRAAHARPGPAVPLPEPRVCKRSSAAYPTVGPTRGPSVDARDRDATTRLLGPALEDRRRLREQKRLKSWSPRQALTALGSQQRAIRRGADDSEPGHARVRQHTRPAAAASTAADGSATSRGDARAASGRRPACAPAQQGHGRSMPDRARH